MRRRGRSPTVYEGTNTETIEYLDSDDQDELLESLEIEAAEAIRRFRLYFVLVACFAIFLSLILPLLCQEECSEQALFCWTHSIYASILHGLSIFLAKNAGKRSNQDFHWFVLTFVLVSIPMLVWTLGKIKDDIEHFHLGLALGNMTTLSGCMFLRWDDQSTAKSLQELHGLKYEHKSL